MLKTLPMCRTVPASTMGQSPQLYLQPWFLWPVTSDLSKHIVIVIQVHHHHFHWSDLSVISFPKNQFSLKSMRWHAWNLTAQRLCLSGSEPTPLSKNPVFSSKGSLQSTSQSGLITFIVKGKLFPGLPLVNIQPYYETELDVVSDRWWKQERREHTDFVGGCWKDANSIFSYNSRWSLRGPFGSVPLTAH